MPTLHELCATMATSGRSLTPRAARDWWTKGLLPRPRRRGLGRGRGTETFWTEPGILERAQAAYDLLAAYPRAYTAILGLWLWGFPMDLGSVRAAYGTLISRHLGAIRDRAGQLPDDVVSKLAEMSARKIAESYAVPIEAQQALTDLTIEFFEVFYGLDEELASSGLAALWERAAPYLSPSSDVVEIHPQDEDLASWAKYLKEMASLTAQRGALTSATDYELIRARRVVHLAFGCLRRLSRMAERGQEFEELGHRLLMVFGRPAVPILITLLRDDSSRHSAVSFLLDLSRRASQVTFDPSMKVFTPSPFVTRS
jgi:hypothetical protein